jgi:hypothetical protein
MELSSNRIGNVVRRREDGLKVIIDRRNTIAHEADMDPTNPGFRWTINANMANEAQISSIESPKPYSKSLFNR